MISMLAGDAQALGASLSWLGSALTTSFTVFFLGWVYWAWRPANRARMEMDARLPFDDGE